MASQRHSHARHRLTPEPPPVCSRRRRCAALNCLSTLAPQHLVFSQDGRFLYLLGEMSGLIAVFERNATTCGLERVERVPIGEGANWIQVVRVT